MNRQYVLRELKLEILSRCPLQCPHCSSTASADATDILELTVVRRLVREFRLLGGEAAAVSGGEPLEHPDLLEILATMAEAGVRTTLYTSGTSGSSALTPISPGLADSLRPVVGEVAFSFHGATPGDHDRFTGIPGSFHVLLSSLSACQLAHIPISVHFVPTADNYRSLPPLVELLKQLGVPRVSLLRFVPHGRGAASRLAMDAAQLRELQGFVEHLMTEHTITIRLGSPFRILRPSGPPCTAAVDRLLVTSTGAAYPCDAFKGFVCADPCASVLAEGLRAVWTQSHLLRAVRVALTSVPDVCRDCPAAAECRGGCLAQRAFAAGCLTTSLRDPGCLRCFGNPEEG